MKHHRDNTGTVVRSPIQKKQTRTHESESSNMLNRTFDRSKYPEEQIYCKERKLDQAVLIQKLELLPEEFFEQQENDDIKKFCTIEKQKNIKLMTWTAVIIMVFALIASYLIIALTGLQYMHLPDTLIYCLGGSTISSILSTGMIVFKYQFQPEQRR